MHSGVLFHKSVDQRLEGIKGFLSEKHEVLDCRMLAFPLTMERIIIGAGTQIELLVICGFRKHCV